MTKEALGVCGRDGLESFSDGAEKLRFSPSLGRPEMGFDLGPHQFDGIKVGTVGGEEDQLDSEILEELLCGQIVMRGEIVTDDDVPTLQGRAKDLADISAKDQRVGRSGDHQAGTLSAQPERTEHGGGVPMAHRSVIMEALAPRGAAAQPGKVGLGAGLIEENQSRRRPLALVLFPELSPFDDVSALLFAGPQGFF